MRFMGDLVYDCVCVCAYVIGIFSLFLSFTPLAKWQTIFEKGNNNINNNNNDS